MRLFFSGYGRAFFWMEERFIFKKMVRTVDQHFWKNIQFLCVIVVLYKTIFNSYVLYKINFILFKINKL